MVVRGGGDRSRPPYLQGMDAVAGETVEQWRLPPEGRPPLIGELVSRIDEALATARASEAAVMTVGAAALEAAEQARRAAELAERASRMASASPVTPAAAPVAPAPAGGKGELSDFHARADFVAARLRELQRVPLGHEANVESPR